jgi:predicted nucleic-acid-binding protein
MIGIDSNILARIILNDSEQESRQARVILEEGLSAGGVFVATGVLLEVSWVLKMKKFPRQRVHILLAQFIAIPGVILEQPELIKKTLEFFRAGQVDFGDSLIWTAHRLHGVTTLKTFDKEFQREIEKDLFVNAIY